MLELFVAGEYLLALAGAPLGIFEGDAGLPIIQQQTKAEPINNTSRYGKSTIDGVGQGADWFAQFICLESILAGVSSAFWPFSAIAGHMGVIGRLYWALASQILFTAVAGTPAEGNPATITATKAILAPGYNTQQVFGPTLRKVPLRLQLLPYTTGGAVVWFTQT